ncbi:hypothetical protein KUTeg_014283 [Tegillarca granosa]|uniref:non-specific serine/threonine protein kinase n=1 Tax=Tegillarca granosa TaxID=220873 RepID=A0ABQ9EW47_TEGGR|nr:hypothetical protein KUTeg_014283 [Tegillarca granosa]
MDENSLRERQEDELKVIEAIYMQDVEDLRSADAWKVYRPPELRIKLKPQQSMSNADTVYAQVDMVVKCTQRYPLEIPEIRLENAKGLSNNQIAVLESDLKEKSKMLIGEVMLLELAQHIEQFLHDNNKPPAKSFYEEMMSNKQKEQQKQNEEQEKKLQQMKRKEEKEGYDIDFPSSESSTTSNDNPPTCSPIGTPGSPRRRTRISISPSPLIIRQNSDKQGDQKPRRQRSVDLCGIGGRTSTPMQDHSNGVTDNYCKTHTGGIISLVFNTKTERTIHRGACLGHGNGGSAVFAGIDTNTGELVAISEWVLKWRHIGRKKLLESIKSEDKEGSVYLKHILMEYSGGYSLETHLIKGQPVSLDLLKNYTEEILLALDYLHSKDVVHKNIRVSSIFVDNNGKIRLSDYRALKKVHKLLNMPLVMSDLYTMVENGNPVPDSQKSSARYGKKADIYQLGGVLLSLYQGMLVSEDSANIPSTIPEEFRDFLDKCLLKDERQRWPVHQLLEHNFIKTPLQAISHFVQPKNSKTKNKDNQLQQNTNSESNTDEEDQVELFITALEASGQSRLTSEFEILKSLGKGGFGDVIKVRNKLDRRLYAIKRIPLNPKSKAFNKKITREVKLLSRLNHENVVRRNADMSDDVVFKSKDVTDSQNDTKIEESVPKLQYLYIQMEYCERSTLRNCIDAGLFQDVNRVWRLFREIIEGLLHIHEQPASISVLEASLFNTSAADTTNSLSGSVGEGHLTGQVGTALYVSPEMMTGEMRITYSQKVDIYSLGIIFFEMCYKPLSTGMERVQILGNLRQKEIKLPEDFDQVTMENQTHIIRWLLNHNPSLRPSSKDLLQSPYLPPPQMEEGELDEILRSAISDPQSKTYKHMVKTMLSQSINAADDLLYDSEFYKNPFEMRRVLIHQLVNETIVRIFHKHGAIKLTTPLLMPRCSQTDSNDHHIYFMDQFGRPVGIPFDLRVPFARFVARNNIAHLKRYCIGRVYRERVFRDRKVHGQHPRELTDFIPDAELLVLIQDVIFEFPVLQQRNYYIRINHISILYAVLLHFNIPEEKHEEVLLTLAGTKVDSHNRHLITKALSNFGLSEQTTASLTSLLEMEGPVSKIASYLRCITKTRGPIKKFYSPLLSSASHTDVTHYAVGVSVAFEKIVLALAENKEYHPSSPYDILVCTIGHKSMFKEVISVLHDLWKAGLRADILLETLQSPEHIQEFCRKEGIMFMVIFKDNDTSGVKVKTIEKDRVTEKKVKLSELIDFLQQRLNTMKMEQTEVSQTQIGKSISVIPTQPHYDTNQSASSNSSLMINFVFILPESTKLASNTKKKYEAQLDGDESMFESSISIIIEKHQRHRKYLGKIIDHIHHLKFEKKYVVHIHNMLIIYLR